MTLNKLKTGSKAVVTKLACHESALRNKLLALGLVAGTPLEVIHRAPLGDPITVEVFSSKIALRLNEAEHIQVTLV